MRAAGEAVSFGIFLPWNAGEEDAVLDKLVPLSASEGLQMVGAASSHGSTTAWARRRATHRPGC